VDSLFAAPRCWRFCSARSTAYKFAVRARVVVGFTAISGYQAPCPVETTGESWKCAGTCLHLSFDIFSTNPPSRADGSRKNCWIHPVSKILSGNAQGTCIFSALAPGSVSQVHHTLQAMSLLQSALVQRPKSPALRIALCALASHMGMLQLALDQVHELQLRQVQLDSLAHHILPAIAAARHSPRAAAFLNRVRC
jgi:hypothetical protein